MSCRIHLWGCYPSSTSLTGYAQSNAHHLQQRRACASHLDVLRAQMQLRSPWLGGGQVEQVQGDRIRGLPNGDVSQHPVTWSFSLSLSFHDMPLPSSSLAPTTSTATSVFWPEGVKEGGICYGWLKPAICIAGVLSDVGLSPWPASCFLGSEFMPSTAGSAGPGPGRLGASAFQITTMECAEGLVRR